MSRPKGMYACDTWSQCAFLSVALSICLSHTSLAGNAGGAVAAGAPALFADSATKGIGESAAGAIAAVACTALDGDAGCPAGVVAAAAALFVTFAVM
eukprot:700099-Pyramimonas_sp.AAC.1